MFESGQIVEQGSHSELMQIDEDGVYKRLVLSQAIDHMDEEEEETNEKQNDVKGNFIYSNENTVKCLKKERQKSGHYYCLKIQLSFL